MEYYKKVHIKTQADLPKEDGMYLVGIKGGEPDFWSWSNNPNHNEISRIEYWLNTFDYYLLPDPSVELYKELCEKQKELIIYSEGRNGRILSVTAEELRQRIEEITKQIKG